MRRTLVTLLLGALASSSAGAQGALSVQGWGYPTGQLSAASLGVGGLGFVSTPVAAGACCSALGFGLILYLSTGQSTLQLNAPDAARGKVMALWAMTLSASAPLGHLIAGSVARVWSVPAVLLTMSLGAALAAVGIIILAAGRGLKE